MSRSLRTGHCEQVVVCKFLLNEISNVLEEEYCF